MKLEERGRAKYRPLKDYDRTEVRQLLMNKILEEQQLVPDYQCELFTDAIVRDEDKVNIGSLFSGCGGLDLGVELAGLDVSFGKEQVDLWLKSKQEYFQHRSSSIFHTIYTIDLFKEANETYQSNFSDTIVQYEDDIRKVSQFPDSDIVLGGFPCPGFSEAGPRLIDDSRNFLYIHFIRCLMQTKPLFFIAENVKGMLTLGKGEVLRQILQDFESAGYRVKHRLVNARDFGAPQYRERVFLVGVREDLTFEYEFPEPTHGDNEGLLPFVTLRKAIGDLVDNPGEWYEGGFSPIYLSRNRKKSWDDQSFTVQASGRQAPLHPGGPPMEKVNADKWRLPGDETDHRRLSVKEIARIQTFPDWFTFSEGKNENISKNGKLNKVYKQIGNAVPVELARAIAKPIAAYCHANLDEIKAKRETSMQLQLF